MKKILIIAAAAICAVVSQAAQVSWSASGVNKSGTNLDKGTISGFMFDTSVVSVKDVQDALKAGTFDTLVSKAIGSSGTSAAAGTVNGAAKDEVAYNGGDVVTAFAVIIDASDLGSANNAIITSTVTKTLKGSGITSFGFGSQTSNNSWTPVGVPEPTAIALIALGLAAVGLKRKVA